MSQTTKTCSSRHWLAEDNMEKQPASICIDYQNSWQPLRTLQSRGGSSWNSGIVTSACSSHTTISAGGCNKGRHARKLAPYLGELISHHITDPPGLVLCSLAQGWHHQGLQVLLRQQGCNADTSLHCKQPHWVLIEKGVLGSVRLSLGLKETA